MSVTRKTLGEPRVAPPPRGRPAGHGPVGASQPAEPATARALWPTFMRRTLDEEALRKAPRAAAE
jgi:hypothetical protein